MKKLLKWLSIAFGSLLLLVVAAAIVVPLVFDVDKYRPQIAQAANERINGKLELGKLSLSLWGQIRIQVQGLSLADSAARKVLAVNDAYFHLPFASLLSGAPEMVFHMTRPELWVSKNKAGKLNLLGLMKSQPDSSGAGNPAATPSTTPGSPPAATASGSSQLPAIVSSARLGVELRDALVNYRDESTGLSTQVKDLNLVMRDLSLSRRTDIELWADLDTRMAAGGAQGGQGLAVKGPFKLVAHAKPELVNGAFDHAAFDAKLDLDDLEIASGAVFRKAKGVPFNFDLAGSGSAHEAKVERFDVKFHNAVIKSSGTLTNLGAAPAAGSAVAPSPVVDFRMASNDIDLKSWNELIPMLKEYELGGSAKLDASAQGPADKLGYKAKLVVNALTAKAGRLKAQPRFDAVVDVATDQIQNVTVTMKAPANELTFKGKLVSFTQPQGTFELTSPGMDLDQLVEWPPAAAAGAPATTPAGAPAGAASSGPAAPGGAPATGVAAADTDASLDPLRANPMLAKASLSMATQIRSLKAKGITMNDLVGKLYLRDLTAGLEGFAVKLWKGSIKAGFAAQLRPKTPTYSFNVGASGLQLKEAVANNVQMFKNTVMGLADFSLSGTGASFNPEPAKANLKAKGSMRIANATFGTIDVGRMAVEGINKAIERIGEKVPGAKGKTVNVPGGRESRYELVSSDFTIEGGKFRAPNFVAKAEANQGIDLKGSTEVGLKDYSLNTTWELIDTYNFTKARDLSVDVGGQKVEHILAEGNQPVRFPVSAGCTCFQPCYSYTQVPEFLAKVALGNVAGAAGARAKAEVQKRVESVIPKSAPPAVQDAVKGLGKKLFGR